MPKKPQSLPPVPTLLHAPILPPPRPVFPVRDFAARNPAFPVATVRDLIFKAEQRHTAKGKLPGNGLIEAGAILRVGRKVLIDEARFFAWVDSIQPKPASPGRG